MSSQFILFLLEGGKLKTEVERRQRGLGGRSKNGEIEREISVLGQSSELSKVFFAKALFSTSPPGGTLK